MENMHIDLSNDFRRTDVVCCAMHMASILFEAQKKDGRRVPKFIHIYTSVVLVVLRGRIIGACALALTAFLRRYVAI